jgi:hypothetical protein
MSQRASNLHGHFGTTKAVENECSFITERTASDMTKYNLDLGTVRFVRWVEGGISQQKITLFFCGNENADRHIRRGSFIHKGIISATALFTCNQNVRF